MQEKDYKWFIDNYQSIYDKYGKTYVVISEQKIVGNYSSYAEAVKETSKTIPVGNFIVQYCNGDESAYTGYIASTNFTVAQNYA